MTALRLRDATRRAVLVGLVALVALVGAAAVVVTGVRVARDRGAFGCDYRPRPRTVTWRLAQDPRTTRARIGEGVLLASPDGRPLHDVAVDGAGLAPGTQNGIEGYVFAVTERGRGTVTAITADGTTVRGLLSVHC
ncbi:MAG: hypothetical protein JWN17_3114 [Frankiales bacterium]|nr:hypothetical protein [Frankiales bacterium]